MMEHLSSKVPRKENSQCKPTTFKLLKFILLYILNLINHTLSFKRKCTLQIFSMLDADTCDLFPAIVCQRIPLHYTEDPVLLLHRILPNLTESTVF